MGNGALPQSYVGKERSCVQSQLQSTIHPIIQTVNGTGQAKELQPWHLTLLSVENQYKSMTGCHLHFLIRWQSINFIQFYTARTGAGTWSGIKMML